MTKIDKRWRCPKCGSGTEQTTNWQAGWDKDYNDARCAHCGWKGEAWECVKEDNNA